MKKKRLTKRFLAKKRYAEKRRTPAWKNRKKYKVLAQRIRIKRARKMQKQKEKIPHDFPAPSNFSIIDNTDKVLEYFEEAEKMLRSGENVTLNITDVEVLTSATVGLMVANINDADFLHDSIVAGEAPKKKELFELFTGSGFYDHVLTNGKFSKNVNSLLHKEVNKKVVSEVARDASLTGFNHVFGKKNPFESPVVESLYDILVEAMSNTNNHADLHIKGKCNWWLYVYSDPKNKITSYSFFDLGVGIFKSIVVQNYLKQLAKDISIYPNIKLVDDLLAGKIQSRIEEDKKIRGKGIPQIVEHAAIRNFKSFYIIANDVKINLKTKQKEQLKHNLNGTFIYWELQN